MKEKIYIGIFLSFISAIFIGSIWWIKANSPTASVKEMMHKEINIMPQLESAQYGITNLVSKTKEYGAALGDGAIISRPIRELNGFKHYGVMYKGLVAHYNQYGFHLDSLSIFAKNEVVKVVSKGLKGKELKLFKERIIRIFEKYKHSKYNAMSNNCEHFATEAVFGQKTSVQSKFANDMIRTYEPTILAELQKSKFGLLVSSVKYAIDSFVGNDSLINKKQGDGKN